MLEFVILCIEHDTIFHVGMSFRIFLSANPARPRSSIQSLPMRSRDSRKWRRHALWKLMEQLDAHWKDNGSEKGAIGDCSA